MDDGDNFEIAGTGEYRAGLFNWRCHLVYTGQNWNRVIIIIIITRLLLRCISQPVLSN